MTMKLPISMVVYVSKLKNSTLVSMGEIITKRLLCSSYNIQVRFKCLVSHPVNSSQ